MAQTMHEISFSDQDYIKAAERWEKQLLLLPLMAAQDTLKFMTPMGGIRTKVHLGAAESSAQFAPYKYDRKSVGTTTIDWRVLEPQFGNVCEDFEPNSVIRSLLGANAAFLGDGQKQAPSAKLVLACVAKSLGAHLEDVIFSAKRDATGDTTADLFDGFGTIADAEITAENISSAKGNLMTLSEAVDATNAVDLAKEIVYSLDPHLRKLNTFLYCSQDFADKYNEAYLLTHSGIIYNERFEQMFVEGSNRRMTLCPLPCLDGTDKFFVAPKENMIYGYDNMSDLERLQVDRFSPWVLTMSAAMFFGVQFRSIDKRMLKVVKLAAAASGGGSDSGSGSGNGSGGDNGGSTPVVTSKVATPTFDPASWAEGESLTVELATETDGATIHYTTNGDTPTAESTAYDSTNKITLSATTTIKAIAVKEGMTASDVATKAYTKPE